MRLPGTRFMRLTIIQRRAAGAWLASAGSSPMRSDKNEGLAVHLRAPGDAPTRRRCCSCRGTPLFIRAEVMTSSSRTDRRPGRRSGLKAAGVDFYPPFTFIVRPRSPPAGRCLSGGRGSIISSTVKNLGVRQVFLHIVNASHVVSSVSAHR